MGGGDDDFDWTKQNEQNKRKDVTAPHVVVELVSRGVNRNRCGGQGL